MFYREQRMNDSDLNGNNYFTDLICSLFFMNIVLLLFKNIQTFNRLFTCLYTIMKTHILVMRHEYILSFYCIFFEITLITNYVKFNFLKTNVIIIHKSIQTYHFVLFISFHFIDISFYMTLHDCSHIKYIIIMCH